MFKILLGRQLFRFQFSRLRNLFVTSHAPVSLPQMKAMQLSFYFHSFSLSFPPKYFFYILTANPRNPQTTLDVVKIKISGKKLIYRACKLINASISLYYIGQVDLEWRHWSNCHWLQSRDWILAWPRSLIEGFRRVKFSSVIIQ